MAWFSVKETAQGQLYLSLRTGNSAAYITCLKGKLSARIEVEHYNKQKSKY
jgi:hypothetical protein